MSIREKVAQAIVAHQMSRHAVHGTSLDEAAAAITAFLEAAAEQGWKMVPEGPTGEMELIGNEAWLEEKAAGYIYRAMCRAAKFEWDK